MSDAPVLVVLGAAGQVGAALANSVPPAGWRILALDRRTADITRPAELERALAGIEAGIVVNCAAYTAVDRAEDEPQAAFSVNRDGAGHIAAAAARRHLAVVHFSTDYVFDGAKKAAYVEDDPAAPLSVYGASKLAGEASVRAATPRHLILRTSWVFGTRASCFPRAILARARVADEIPVVDDQIGCPTAAEDLAAVVMALAPRLAAAGAASRSFGTFHCCGDQPVSWLDFAREVVAGAAALGGRSPRLTPVSAAAYPRPARRPAWSALSCERLKAVHGIEPPSWRRGLARCLPKLMEEW
jgi:dTDP-4-dehydrorhamnose reductase